MRWQSGRSTTQGIFPLAVRAEADAIRGHAAANCALKLREKGVDPALIIGHPGWGETLFLKEIFPNARMILHGEFFYRTDGGDVGFDPEFGEFGLEERFRVHAKNGMLSLAYAEADRIVCPTRFQRDLLPEAFRARSTIIHEGVDTGVAHRIERASVTLPSGLTLDRSRPVVTFVNRRFEPLRGFHVFMRALPAVLDALPEAHVVLVGADEDNVYGARPKEGGTWKQALLKELEGRLDLERVHFPGRLTYRHLIELFSLSAAHVYLTYPFVLSWSLLDAMAAEALVIGSDTAPVREVVEDGVNGRLVDFFDGEALSAAIVEACAEPKRFAKLRKAARRTVVERYDRKSMCLPAWVELVDGELAI